MSNHCINCKRYRAVREGKEIKDLCAKSYVMITVRGKLEPKYKVHPTYSCSQNVGGTCTGFKQLTITDRLKWRYWKTEPHL